MKLITFDIDGTTINRFRNVTKLTIQTLKALHEAGFILVPTTGRCLNEIPNEILDLNICNYAITSNGAVVTNLINNSRLHENLLEPKDILSLFDGMNISEWMVSIHADNEVFDTHNLLRISRRLLFHKDLKFRNKIRNLTSFVIENPKIEKVQLTTTSKQNMDCLVKGFQKNFDFEMPISRSRYIEISAREATKRNAVEILRAHLQIDLENVFAIGDDMNDLELIKHVGMGVAMGNANALVKESANFVTSSNRSEGFYYAIKKYFPENIKF